LGQELVPVAAISGHYLSSSLIAFIKRDVMCLVVPFLCDLLKDETVQNKELILDILHDLALYVEGEKSVTASDVTQYRIYSKRIYSAVCNGLDIYKALIDDSDSETKQAAFDILRVLDKCDPII
jgi:hypothetical protein